MVASERVVSQEAPDRGAGRRGEERESERRVACKLPRAASSPGIVQPALAEETAPYRVAFIGVNFYQSRWCARSSYRATGNRTKLDRGRSRRAYLHAGMLIS